MFSGRGVEVMQEEKDDFSSKYKIKDNTRKDKYPFDWFEQVESGWNTKEMPYRPNSFPFGQVVSSNFC